MGDANIYKNKIYGGTGTADTINAIHLQNVGPGTSNVYENFVFKNGSPVHTNVARSVMSEGGVVEIYNNYLEVFDSVTESNAVYLLTPNPKVYNNIMVHNSTASLGGVMPLVHLHTSRIIPC
jgi:hypothetical protein